jgi:RNA polymerase sigma-70 factor (ECF subfamily)
MPEPAGVVSGPAPAELDELTLKRAQRGEAPACRALVERYQNAVFALLSRLLGPGQTQLCEDLAQETFLAVFRALSQFSPLGPARLSTWILTIASRRAVDELRRSKLRCEPITAAVDLVAPLHADEESRQRALGAAIQRALEDLVPEYRAAFLLREYHGLDYADIARALGVELGTVKSRIARARQRVREAAREVRHDQD